MLTIICCGVERTSSYCPNCGKKLEHPLAGLYRHLDGVVKTDLAKLDAAKKDVKMQKDNPVVHKRGIARMEKNLAKWTGWFDSLGLVVEGMEITAENLAENALAEDEGKKSEKKAEPAEKKK